MLCKEVYTTLHGEYFHFADIKLFRLIIGYIILLLKPILSGRNNFFGNTANAAFEFVGRYLLLIFFIYVKGYKFRII